MQKLFFSIAACLVLSLCLTSCVKDSCQSIRTYQVWEPVYVKSDAFRINISPEPPQDVCATGQLYYYQDYLLIADPDQGIHIINNSEADNPQAVAYLPIPGIQNMAIHNNLLYTNSYVDLLVFDFSQPSSPQLLTRQEEVFLRYGEEVAEIGYLVNYEARDEEITVDCDQPDWGNCFDCLFIDRAFNNAEAVAADGSTQSASGIGGSLARFTMSQGHMYVVDESSMRVFDLSQGANPEQVNDIHLGWGIETIFPYEKNLFIGSTTGMHIYDNNNPAAPQFLSVFSHANACDPVYVDGDIAYVTLRDGTECQDFTNQLDVIDVTDLTNPQLLRSYPMHHPIGLSVLNDHLYLCEDDQGVKVFDVSSWQDIDNRMVAHLRNMQARDIITLPGKNQAIVIGDEGLLQLDINNPTDIRELSIVPACN